MDDESLNEPPIKNQIVEEYNKDNGIIIVTDKSTSSVDIPDWFDEPIKGQHWNDPTYKWKDIIEIVHVKKLRNIIGSFMQIQEMEIEEDREVLNELEKIQLRPETPNLYDELDDLYSQISESVKKIHDSFY